MHYTWDDFSLNFWDSFTALQLLGLPYRVLDGPNWRGWTTTPPCTHPFRYLVCNQCDNVVARVDSLRSLWTYHEQVGLVMEDDYCGVYFLIEGIKEEGWRLRKIDGILT